MSRTAQRFRQGDVTRAIKAAVAAGLTVGRVEIEGGKIIVIAGQQEQNSVPTPLDQWRAERGES
jgi:hypothetical protein